MTDGRACPPKPRDEELALPDDNDLGSEEQCIYSQNRSDIKSQRSQEPRVNHLTLGE